jgi:hypothetical protein
MRARAGAPHNDGREQVTAALSPSAQARVCAALRGVAWRGGAAGRCWAAACLVVEAQAGPAAGRCAAIAAAGRLAVSRPVAAARLLRAESVHHAAAELAACCWVPCLVRRAACPTAPRRLVVLAPAAAAVARLAVFLAGPACPAAADPDGCSDRAGRSAVAAIGLASSSAAIIAAAAVARGAECG